MEGEKKKFDKKFQNNIAIRPIICYDATDISEKEKLNEERGKTTARCKKIVG